MIYDGIENFGILLKRLIDAQREASKYPIPGNAFPFSPREPQLLTEAPAVTVSGSEVPF